MCNYFTIFPKNKINYSTVQFIPSSGVAFDIAV